MPKSIVICCDGTNGKFGVRNTNVVRLFGLLQHDPATQVAFYDPGIGTMSPPGALTKTVQAITMLLGAAVAYGVRDRIGEAYCHLMEAHEVGDRVYLFGFSRGAYIVRALAALLHMFGLIRRGNENLVPYATAMFSRHDPEVFRLADEFKATFSRDCPVHFMGVWDTVSSVGWIYNPVTFPYTANNPSIKVGRHAIAIDERRCYFRQNLWGAPAPGQDLQQVWFPGVHSDVGGGYAPEESGLANVSLQWMVEEAVAHGLLLDPARAPAILSRPEHRPDPLGPMHKSLAGPWWILEFWPKRYVDTFHDPPQVKFRIPLGKRRRIPSGAVLHPSVLARCNALGSTYLPKNIPTLKTTLAESTK